MPRRTDIHTILIIGSGPIVIGQGCEFDYSGVQACRALKEEGFRIVLINSNPATIMTDPEFADATYVEPITPEAVEKILIREAAAGHPIDALLPTLGGQTGLNTGMACFDQGILTRHNVKMIGADRDAILRGEDRQVFKDLMIKIGLKVPISRVVHNMADARETLEQIGLPLIIRPAFTLGGTGGGIAYNIEEFETIVQRGIDASPVNEVLIEQSVIGWKEFELEVMRDKNDNVVIICSIENIDPMGVHTGDSITVAPIQTLTDKEYQRMRDAAIAVIRAVGVETGGSNIQFATNPETGEMVVVEMNPRVSRSSALASKATGYPIAKIAAKLAVGYTLDELPNYITSRKSPGSGSTEGAPKWDLYTSACFEPTIDYVVIKIPRWTFEKFPDADETLTTQMKSVGEAMAIGRTFKEALQKGIRSMEVKRFGFGLDKNDKWLTAQAQNSGVGASPTNDPRGRGAHATETTSTWPIPEETLRRKLAIPSQGRLYYIRYALKMGWTIDQVHQLTNIDPWFLAQMKELVDFESKLALAVAEKQPSMDYFALMQHAKEWGYSDVQLSQIMGISPREMREFRKNIGVQPVYKLVDTCAAEFEAATPYYYSTYEVLFISPGVESTKTAVRDAIKHLREAKSVLGKLGHVEPFNPNVNEIDVDSLLSRTPPTWTESSACEDEIRLTDRPKVIIIGGGPNRIGQGIEFDYCCVQAAFAMRKLGIESVMINSNPETVSTDYDTSDLLFFEPLTHEDILNICERLNGGSFPRLLTVDQDAGDLSDAERAGVEHELRNRNLGPTYLLKVWRPDKQGDPSAFLLHCARSHSRVIVLNADATFADYVEDASGSGKDALRDNDALAHRVADWHKQAKKTGLVQGVIVQFGGQTPLNLARGLSEAGVPIIGTSVDSLDAAGDREQFRDLLKKLGLKQPENGIARNIDEARKIATEIGYPVLVRPSFVLGGRAMEIVSDQEQLDHYMTHAVEAASGSTILVDKFLDAATEVDVDCLADFLPLPLPLGEGRGEGASDDKNVSASKNTLTPALSQREREQDPGRAIIIGVMEHIEEAGIHSGDSACSLPPYSLSKEIVAKLKDQTRELAKALRVRGLMNVQYAIKDNEIYVIEVNPRASRTVPFVSKAHGIPWAKIAAKVMVGKTLDELGIVEPPPPKHISVKEVVFPFSKFPGVDVILGPEMRSTGEVMGIDENFALAFAKSQIAAGSSLPTEGTVYISVRNADKEAIIPIARQFADEGFDIITTGGTFNTLSKAGIEVTRINKLAEGRPNIADAIKNGKVQLIINTPTRKGPATDEGKIRAMSVLNRVPIVTTIAGASAAVRAISALRKTGWNVKPLQEYHAQNRK